MSTSLSAAVRAKHTPKLPATQQGETKGDKTTPTVPAAVHQAVGCDYGATKERLISEAICGLWSRVKEEEGELLHVLNQTNRLVPNFLKTNRVAHPYFLYPLSLIVDLGLLLAVSCPPTWKVRLLTVRTTRALLVTFWELALLV